MYTEQSIKHAVIIQFITTSVIIITGNFKGNSCVTSIQVKIRALPTLQQVENCWVIDKGRKEGRKEERENNLVYQINYVLVLKCKSKT